MSDLRGSSERARQGGAVLDPSVAPRVLRPNRTQLEWRPMDLEGMLPADHRARVVWEFVEGLDLGPLYQAIRAVEGHAGRPAIDPAILMAVWLYATLEAVGSARALERLCEHHDAYRWLCGGVSVNYHTLASFRVGHGAVLEQLLTHSVAALMAAGQVSLARIAQDGVRVRASAGRGSFRRRPRLEAGLAAAEAHVAALRREVDEDPAATTRRQRAARERAARERQARVQAALAELPALEAYAARRAKKDGRAPRAVRASTTDPEARVMKMADGGFRPAFNVQLAADTASQLIVGVAVTNAGTDQGQLAPMLEGMQRRYGRTPAAVLADGGYVALEDIRAVGQRAEGCRVYAPPPAAPTRAGRPLWRADDATIAEWRQRMCTPEAAQIYKERAATIECVNALARNRGLQRFLVRGVERVRAVVLWLALAHNLLRAVSLPRLHPATG
jgi:transposase/IS5 family transposase